MSKANPEHCRCLLTNSCVEMMVTGWLVGWLGLFGYALSLPSIIYTSERHGHGSFVKHLATFILYILRSDPLDTPGPYRNPSHYNHKSKVYKMYGLSTIYHITVKQTTT